jgi:hypothetical protein
MNPTIRPGSASRINYILISTPSIVNLPFTPFEFTPAFIDLLSRSPRDIFQFFWPEEHFHLYFKFPTFKGIDCHIFYSEDFVRKNLLLNTDYITVFIVDDFNEKIIELIKDKFSFFYLTSSNQDISDEILKRYPDITLVTFQGTREYFKFLNRDKDKILAHLEQKKLPTLIELAKGLEKTAQRSAKLNEPDFRAAKTNIFTVNQVFGDFWHLETSIEHILPEHRSASIVQACQQIDSLYFQLLEKKIMPLLGHGWPLLNPIILIFPYQSPRYLFNIIYAKNGSDPYFPEDIDTNPEAYRTLAESEQNLKYLYEYVIPKIFEKDPNLGKKMEAMKSHEERELGFLDFGGYLHASFSFSPVIRFPIVGKSIHEVLEPFAPEEYDDTAIIDINYKYFKRFGVNLREHTFGHDIEEYLKNRNGQVVVISDLPVEWTDIDGVPLSFSHDVCRMPATPPSRLMNRYVFQNFMHYEMSDDILERTLVILGSPDDPDFVDSYEVVKKTVQDKLPVHLETCRTIDQVANAVNKFKPEFLIFDTHGDYDKSTGSSFLWIGDQKLTNIEIVNHNIGAPLLFLSSCFTNPTYGYLNSIAYAFFDAGAFSVSTTFLPIGIKTSTTLYIRILNNIKLAISDRIYSNWLGFLGGNIRTSLITQAMFELQLHLGNFDLWTVFNQDIFTKQHVAWSEKAMKFDSRREAYQTWKEVFFKAVRKEYRTKIEDLLNSNSIEPEHLYYSHLGRPDLIFFRQ